MESTIKEGVKNSELHRKLEKLKYLYLINKICLKSIEEDLQCCLTFRWEGKLLKELIAEEVENIKIIWINLINGRANELKEFENLSQVLLENLCSNDHSLMSEGGKDNIQNSARALIRLIDQVLKVS